jgi:hypothetical protein
MLLDSFRELLAAKMVALVEIRCDSWRDAVEACRLLTSPAYHLLRRRHRLPDVSYLGQSLALPPRRSKSALCVT